MAQKRMQSTARSLLFCCAIVAAAAMPAVAADLENFRQMSAKARQLVAAHDDQGARVAYVAALATLDARDESQAREVAVLEADAYFELATLDERLERNKDAAAEYTLAIASCTPLGLGDGYKVIFPSLQRQQVLYLQDGDFEHAAEAATRELNLMTILRGRDAPLTSGAASMQLPPVLVIARSYTGMKRFEEAKKTYDYAWGLAETSVIPPPGALDKLYTGSVVVYSRLNLNEQIDELKKRADRIKARQAEQYTTQTSVAPPQTAFTKRDNTITVANPDIKAGFKEGALQKCKPDYPREVYELKQQGKVVIHFQVASDGDLLSSAIAQSSGFKLLDRATINALSRCKFSPAMYQGQPVNGEFDATYVWKLD